MSILFDRHTLEGYNFRSSNLHLRKIMGKSYLFSFVAGGLLQPETQSVLERFLITQNWDILKKEIATGSLLRTTRVSSRMRYFQEIRRRAKVAHPFEITYIARQEEQSRLANFALCCRYYDLLGAFMLDVIREKLARHDTILTNMDFYSFFEEKSRTHPELTRLAETSRRKVQTVIARMLAEAGLMNTSTKELTTPFIPQILIGEYLRAGDQSALMHILASSSDIQHALRSL